MMVLLSPVKSPIKMNEFIVPGITTTIEIETSKLKSLETQATAYKNNLHSECTKKGMTVNMIVNKIQSDIYIPEQLKKI